MTEVALMPTDTLVWDNHSCMPLRPGDGHFLPQLERAKRAGFDLVSLNVGFGEQTPAEHLRVLKWFRSWLARHGEYRIVATLADAHAAKRESQLGIVFDIEGARAVGDDLGLVQRYHDLGVRWMLIAYNRSNLAGSGCHDGEDLGLTAFGRALIAKLNQVGIVVCCSHTGERTARDALAVSTKPVIFSHSNCKAVFDHPRNLTDDMIRACAGQGGVVGITGIGDFLAPDGADLVDAYTRHIDHVVQLVGPAHVGLSLDYVYDQQELLDYLATMPHSFPGGVPASVPMLAPEQLGDVTAKLRALGYDERALASLLGGSWTRVAAECWASG